MARKFQVRRSSKNPLKIFDVSAWRNSDKDISRGRKKASNTFSMGSFASAGRILTLILRSLVGWGIFTAIAVGLAVNIMTAQSPLNVIMGRPPQTDLIALPVWTNEQQQFGANKMLTIGDDGGLTSIVMTDTSGATLHIDNRGNSTKSTSVIIKDYSLFVWADNYASVWLHRGSKTMQKFGVDGSLLWQRSFESWPEACWSSEDGYLLLLTNEEGLDQSLILISPRNNELWTYSLPKAALIDAAVAKRGAGVVLAVMKLDGATPQAYSYLLDVTGHVVKVNSLGAEVPRQAVINNDGATAAVGNSYRVVVQKQEPSEKALEINLKYELLELGLGKDFLVVATAIDPGMIIQNNKTSINVYDLNDTLEDWTWQLSEDLSSLAIADENPLILVATAQKLQAFNHAGESLWGLGYKDLGAHFAQVKVSENGMNIGLMDTQNRLSIWKSPTGD